MIMSFTSITPVSGLFFEAREPVENLEISKTKEISFVLWSNSRNLTILGELIRAQRNETKSQD